MTQSLLSIFELAVKLLAANYELEPDNFAALFRLS
jgi:hypothetical protein